VFAWFFFCDEVVGCADRFRAPLQQFFFDFPCKYYLLRWWECRGPVTGTILYLPQRLYTVVIGTLYFAAYGDTAAAGFELTLILLKNSI
jgi:hypothetical protein